jgi:hypothetical protein
MSKLIAYTVHASASIIIIIIYIFRPQLTVHNSMGPHRKTRNLNENRKRLEVLLFCILVIGRV